jgi:hypothetical protein
MPRRRPARRATLSVACFGFIALSKSTAAYGADVIRPVLEAELTRWADEYDQDLTRAHVRAALPADAYPAVARARGVGNLLRKAVDWCSGRDRGDGDVWRLAGVYARLAVPIYPHEQGIRRRESAAPPGKENGATGSA